MYLSLMMTSGCGLSRPLPPDTHCALNVSTHAAPSLQASYWRNYQDQVHIYDTYAKNIYTKMNTITDKDQLGPLTTSTKYQDQVHISDYNLACVYTEENFIIPR